MKSVAIVVVALGLLLAMAAPSLAHGYGGYYAPVHHHHHGYYGGYAPVLVTPAPVVVAPAPVCGYSAYPPAAGPVVVPGPYYYGVPGVSFGYRGPRVSVGVGF